jgi:hypothetical protein
MVRTKGPLLSLEAAGALGHGIIFAQNKGRSYVKQWHKPKQPRSDAQVSRRALASFLAQIWSRLSDFQKSYYADLATQRHVAPYHAFLKLNLDRWTHGKLPVSRPDDEEVEDYAYTDEALIAGGVRCLTATLLWGAGDETFAVLVSLDAGPQAYPLMPKTVQLLPRSETDNQTISVLGLTPGAHNMTVWGCSNLGNCYEITYASRTVDP